MTIRALLFTVILVGDLRAGPISVVATIPDLAAIAKSVGGETVVVQAVCASDQDPHSVEILPSHMLAIHEAGLVLKVGVGLDDWVDDMVKSAGRTDLRVVDCSRKIELIGAGHEHDSGDTHDHEHGHLHSLGNPHYWTTPVSLVPIADVITSALTDVNKDSRYFYAAQFEKFRSRADSMTFTWQSAMKPCSGAVFICYHSTWDYFARDFSLRIYATVEPRPGEEPSPSELAAIINTAKRGGIVALIREPHSPQALSSLIQRESGLPVITLSTSAGGISAESTWTYFDGIIAALTSHCSDRP